MTLHCLLKLHLYRPIFIKRKIDRRVIDLLCYHNYKTTRNAEHERPVPSPGVDANFVIDAAVYSRRCKLTIKTNPCLKTLPARPPGDARQLTTVCHDCRQTLALCILLLLYLFAYLLIFVSC